MTDFVERPLSDRAIMIDGPITTELVDESIGETLKMRKANKSLPISIYFNSCGGDAIAANRFHKHLVEIQSAGTPIIGVVIGECISSPLLVLMACDKRESFANGVFGFGVVQPIIISDVPFLEAIKHPDFIQTLLETRQSAELLNNEIMMLILERSRVSRVDYLLWAQTNSPLSAHDALEFGLIHRIC